MRKPLPQAEVFVYENDSGEIQGFAGMSEIYIEGTFVKSGVQSRRIGRRLLDALRPEKTG